MRDDPFREQRIRPPSCYWYYIHLTFYTSRFQDYKLRISFPDALVQMEKAMKRDNIETNDRQLACAHIRSQEGQDYLKSMAAAANFAWVNRSSMTFLSRQVLEGKNIKCYLTKEYIYVYTICMQNIICNLYISNRRLRSNSIHLPTTWTCTLYMTFHITSPR